MENITKFLKANIVSLVILVGICLLYLILRLPNLTLQPIFADEAIYIRWAQVMRAEPALRFLPLSDGKTPLFMWAMIPFFKIFQDPLFAGRFLSVITGFVTLVGVLFLGWKFINLKVGLWAAFLLAITPYIVFFDRMALVDSMLAAFSIWSLNLALLVIKYSRIDLAMCLGYTLGGGLLTKTPGIFNLLILPVSLISFNWSLKKRRQKLFKIILLFMITLLISVLIYNVLRLGQGFNNLGKRDQDYIFSAAEVLSHPLDPFLPHVNDLIDWLPKFLTMPILLMIVLGFILAFVKKNKYMVTVIVWSIIPLLILMVMLKTFTARYILFSFPPLLVLGGWAIWYVIEKIKLEYIFKVLIMLLILSPLSLYFDLQLLTNLSQAPLPKEERRGYLEDWTAGYGFSDIAQFLIDQSKKGLIVVGTEGSFGTLPDGLQIYLDRHSHQAPPDNQILIIGGKATISAQLKEAALTHPTFFVANKSRFSKFTNGLQLLKEYPKESGEDLSQDSILFFKVYP